MKKLKKIVAKIICNFFVVLYKIKVSFCRKGNLTLLLYTDSRGTAVESFYKQRNPFFSYLNFFRDYNVTYKFCPHKFTSILDFLNFYEHSVENYDHVVLHCGIVDFAPRPLSSYQSMLDGKREYLKSKGWLHYFENRTDYLCDYEGEKTLQFMSLEFLENEILPKLSAINNLIYIGINPVLSDWDGNYWRARPSCINEQLNQDKFLIRHLSKSVNLRGWSDVEIKSFTVDNVHYNQKGLEYIGVSVSRVLDSDLER
ncbi:hypothetical protein [Shewanella sp. cp20]|uniref:hypothetical protein n=1 Tax=Shewanella sp. cp20 TaxID=1521167 RepID=UPI00059FB54B|nr:hypothetical protein [Shewanella sp. cp20]KIO36124.1 hypothetical protein DB48_13090 [Shewanella sp. cp20]